MSTALRRLRDFFDAAVVPIGRQIVLTPLADPCRAGAGHHSAGQSADRLHPDSIRGPRSGSLPHDRLLATVFLAALLRYLKMQPGDLGYIVSVEDQLHVRSSAARWTFSFSLSSSCPRPPCRETVRRRVCLYRLGSNSVTDRSHSTSI